MRRGFTLIELLVAATTASVMFTILAVALQLLFRAQSTTQAEANMATVLHHFAQRLREDAHAAESCSFDPPPAAESDDAAPRVLTLTRDDGKTIVYDFHPDLARVRRRLIHGGQTEARDLFNLPPGSALRWTPPPEDGPPVLSVLVLRPVGEEPQERRPTRKTRIEAFLGMDHRYDE